MEMEWKAERKATRKKREDKASLINIIDNSTGCFYFAKESSIFFRIISSDLIDWLIDLALADKTETMSVQVYQNNEIII